MAIGGTILAVAGLQAGVTRSGVCAAITVARIGPVAAIIPFLPSTFVGGGGGGGGGRIG